MRESETVRTVRRAIDRSGSQAGLARMLGVNERTVRRWLASAARPHPWALAALREYLTATPASRRPTRRSGCMRGQ
jgi:DNA-binding transcriptional regulator YiaG